MFPVSKPVKTEIDGKSGDSASGGITQFSTSAVFPSGVNTAGACGANTGGPLGPNGNGGPKNGKGNGLKVNRAESPDASPVSNEPPPRSSPFTTRAELPSGEI